MSNPGPPSAGAGAPSSTFTPQPSHPPPTPGGSNQAASSAAPASSAQSASTQNLNQIVTDYLLKKGFTKTEAIFRNEMSTLDASGRPVNDSKIKSRKYLPAFLHLATWVENGLDLYRFELGKVLWPVFVYFYLEIVSLGQVDEAKTFMSTLRSRFTNTHEDELKSLATVTLAQHVKENSIAKLYHENKYRIPLSQFVTGNLFNFLERDRLQGGEEITNILHEYCQVDAVERGPIQPFSFEAIYRRSRNLDIDEIDAQEGIPGIVSKTGLANRDVLDNSATLKLGPLPMDPELRDDVVAELQEEDKLNPPRDGKPTLVQELDNMHPIKKEAADSPQRTDIPLPPTRARDVVMEMQKVRENRDRFRIEGRTGGIGPPISACMFTFHNTLGSISCMDFSKDHQLVAAGTTDSYIRVWSLDGKPLKSKLSNEKDLKVNNRKLIGHSGPVYAVSFSDAIANLDHNIYDDGPQPETDSKLLVSCSADGQIRIWSLEVWTCLCIYKGHDGPVTSLAWGPHGHYFASGGWDKTVRIWSQDHASAQRLLVGHDTCVSAITWHPNGTYVFSASDEADKSIRMWSVANGNCVRVFTGHVEYISALECAPNGKILASADVGGNIFLWDISKATRIKRCRGHGKGGIWSLSFSVESNVLASGGQDNTIRIWDVEMPADGHRAAIAASNANAEATDGTIVAASGTAPAAAQAAPQPGPTTGIVTGKKKGKDVMTTPDQISAFPTKKTPVLKVEFTRMNLVVAGGCYDPER